MNKPLSDSQGRKNRWKLLQNNKTRGAYSWWKSKVIKEIWPKKKVSLWKVTKSKLPCIDGSFWLALMHLDNASPVQMTRLHSVAIHGRSKPICLSQSWVNMYEANGQMTGSTLCVPFQGDLSKCKWEKSNSSSGEELEHLPSLYPSQSRGSRKDQSAPSGVGKQGTDENKSEAKFLESLQFSWELTQGQNVTSNSSLLSASVEYNF